MKKNPSLKKDTPGTCEVISWGERPLAPKFIKLKPMPKKLREELLELQRSSLARHESAYPVGGKMTRG